MAEILKKIIGKIRIEGKLLTITADNASNNKTLASQLYYKL